MDASWVRISSASFSKVENYISLTHLGRILKDEQTLESYKIEDGVTIHLVKSKGATAEGTSAPTTAPTATPANPLAGGAGMGGMGGFPGMPGMGMPGMGMPGMGGMGGFPGFPGMATGGGPSGMGGMGGMGGMNPAMLNDMMNNPMVQ